MAKVKNTYPKTFHPSLASRIGMFFAFLMFGYFFVSFSAVFLTALPFHFDSLTLLGAVAVIFIHYLLFSILWYFAEYVFRFRVIVTPNGLWFHGYGKRFYTWDSMIYLNTKNTGLSKNIWGIKTREPQIVYRNLVAKWLIGNWVYDNFIPLEGIVKVPRKRLLLRDIEAFKKTEFGRELFHFAPHLFDEYDKEKRKNRLHDADDDYDYDIVSNEDYQDMSR